MSPGAHPSIEEHGLSAHRGRQGDLFRSWAQRMCPASQRLYSLTPVSSQRAYFLVTETRTVKEIVETLGNVLGQPIRRAPTNNEQWAEALKERLNAHALDHLTHLWRSLQTAELECQ